MAGTPSQGSRTDVSVAGVVLAAGAGRRMGRPKAEIVLAGTRLLDRAVDALRDGGCASLFAVVREGTRVEGAVAIVNPDPGRGMRSSLACALDGIAARGGEEPAALAVLLVDLPGVGATAVRATVAGWRPGRIAVATFAGRRAHPIVMSPQRWRAALDGAGADEGARRYLHAHAAAVDEVAVPGDAGAAGLAADIDTPAELAAWTGSRSRPRGTRRDPAAPGS